jgi:predicted RNA-binding protein (virulence factor B family)
MSCGLAPGLGPLLLATEAQTRSLWLFLGRAAEVKVKLTWQNRLVALLAAISKLPDTL